MQYNIHLTYHVLGLSQRQVAAHFGISLGKVQRTLRKRLPFKDRVRLAVRLWLRPFFAPPRFKIAV